MQASRMAKNLIYSALGQAKAVSALPKAVAGMAMGKINKAGADNSYVFRLMQNIGAPGTLGEKNYNKHFNVMMGMVKQGRQQDALRYSKTQ